MKNKAINIWSHFVKHELIRGSLYIFLGTMISNIFNFIFNIFMSRNLSIEQYGVLTSIISLIMLATIPAGSVIPTVINFAGNYFANKKYDLVNAFFYRVIKYFIFISIIVIFVFVVFSKIIGEFFKISNPLLIILAGFIIAITYLGIINTGLLQAKLSFKFISFSTFIATFMKLLIGISLVLFGFGLDGVMWAIFLSFLVSFVMSFIPLNFILIKGKKAINVISFRNLFSYGIPASLATFGLTSLISTDILLVKHFYDPSFAGIYAGLSLVGKTIFFFTAPIGAVMFPLVIQKQARNEDYNGIFKMAILLVLIPSLLISMIYFLYPDLAIKFFIKKQEYLSVSNLVGLFGLFITLYSVTSLFVYYFLSIRKTKIYISIIFAAISQAILIFFYHKSFLEIIMISIVIISLLLLALVTYYLRTSSKFKKIKKETVLVNNPIV